ncbi:MAG: MFS transporter, partial [Pseudomonadota bacterium]
MGGPAFALALTALMLVLAMSTLDANIVGPALPRIVADLGGISHLSWVMTAFLLTATITTPLYGKLSDMYGRKPLFAVSVGLFLLGSVLSGLAQSMHWLIAGRAVQGLGAGGLMTLTQITMSDLVPPSRRAKYQGLFGAVFTGCSMIGPPLGGFITEALSWRWIFFVNIPVGVIGLALIFLTIHEPPRSPRKPIDYRGVLVVAVATSAALLALSLGGGVIAWLSPISVGLFFGSGLLFMVLIAVEKRSDNPIIEIGLFSNPIFTVATFVSALVSTAVAGAMAFVPLFLQLVVGMAPAASGLMMTPMVAGLMIGLTVGGRFVTKLGRYRVFAVTGTAIATIALTALTAFAFAQTGPSPIATSLTLLGLGLGMVMPGLTVALQNAVSPRDMGVATATSTFIRSLGTAFGVGIAGAIITAFALAAPIEGDHAGAVA